MHATKKKESAPAEAKNQGGVKEKKPESSPSHVNPLWLQLATGFEAPEEAYAGDSRLCVQTKLAVGAPDDPYEQEADRIADQVLRMHTPVIQPKPTRPFAKDPSCGDELQPLQAKSASRTKRQSGPEAILYSAPSDGQPLASSTRSFFEPRFGADFSQVRVHTDARAQRAARDINAKAFTHRNNIFLGTGQSSSDLGLMAHELTHTIQQGGASVEMSGGVQASCAVSHPSDVLEQEADQVDRRGVGGETSIGTITAGGMEQVQRLELPSWADVVSGAEELYEEAVETGEEALEWAEETAEEVGETVGEGMEWVATTAGQAAFDAANTLAGLFGGSVIIRRGCIIVTIPNIPLFPTFQKTLGETPPLGFFVPFAAGGTLIGPLPVAGMVGALAYAQLSAEAAVGPGVLRNVRVEICPFAGRYMGTAQLYAAAAIAPRLTLFGGLFAVGGVLIPMEPPIPIIAIIEGGLRGIGTGWLIGAVQDTVTVLYSGGTLSFSNVAELMGGVLLQGDLQLFAALRLFDRIICQYAHPLGHWETGRAMQLTIPISSALSGSGGTGGVGPITWGPIPIGDIETAIRPLPTGWNCLGWAEIKQILYDNGMLPPQLCEGEEEGEPGVLRNQLALAICKCVDIERKPGEPECGAGKRYLKCFEIDETICKKKGQLQKEADRRCNHDPDLLEKCNRQGGCRFKHTKAMCPVSEDRCKDGYFSTMLEVPDHHEPSPRVPMLPEDVAEHAQRLIDRENYAAALEVVVSGLRLNLDLCYFTYVNRTDAGEGLTTTNYRLDPDTGNYVPDGRSRVEIYSPAFATLPWLVSTVMHEYQHVLQGQRQTTPEELDDPTGEHTAASEVEAYLWEIENAERTGLAADIPRIQDTGARLTGHYERLGQINSARKEQYKVRYKAAMRFIADLATGPPPLPGYPHVYHHGTDYDTAQIVYLGNIEARGRVDFGLGFYTHTKENWQLAKEWALRKAVSERKRGWGVVTFPIPTELWNVLITSTLIYRDQNDRPANAPINPDTGKRMGWREFVRYNFRKEQEGNLPSWPEYNVIRGPLYGRFSGTDIRQVMFTSSGTPLLNIPEVRSLRIAIIRLFRRRRT